MNTPDAGTRTLEVVVVYAFDSSTTTPAYSLVDEVYWLVQSKIGSLAASSRLSYIYFMSSNNTYTFEKRFAASGEKIIVQTRLACTKNMACGLYEADRLIRECENPNGIILLLSDGLANKGDFYDGVEDFVSTWPVHTFTVGSDGYNQGLRTIAANSPGGTFSHLPVPAKPRNSAAFSLYMDDIIMRDDEKPPTRHLGPRTLEVVVVYAFDSSTTTPAYSLVDEVYWLVQSKIGSLAASSHLSYIYFMSSNNTYTFEKRFAASGEKIIVQTRLACTKNMACGLYEADRLIRECENPNGIILLLSDGLANKGDFYDGVEDFVSTWPVHTFTVGGDGYNQGLCTIAANSPGGIFSPLPVPAEPRNSAAFSLYMDDIIMKKPTYNKMAVVLTADSVMVGVELNGASSAMAREGLDLVVVLDIQGSREGGDIKLSKMKKAMEFVIMKLTPMDRLSIISKGEQANRLRQCPLRCMTPAGKADLKALINGLTGRCVNLEQGLVEALAVIRRRVHTEGRTANIFFLTDDNEGYGNARSVDPGNVAVHTFGFGKNAGHELLKDMAKRSPGGTYSFVPDDSDLCAPFSQQLAGFLTVVNTI
ncbi:unnamed protein product [Urochloa decumbens]|uniref:VWFA domain-containing protein n=1 Tax=Urochloa decumbens TaxID=240449 RepID=A0ABC9APK5_9POAL